MKKFFTPKYTYPVRRTKWLYTVLSVLLLLCCDQKIIAQDSLNSINVPKNTLSVSLGEFNGGYSNGFVMLKWVVLVEQELKHFEIERSTDGTNYRKIGQVESKGVVPPADIDYTFLDILAEKGSNFYRLVFVDNDGNFTYSKVITISVETSGISLLVVYPNPFGKKVQVKVNCEVPEKVTIRLIDNGGRVVKKQEASAQKGTNNITVDRIDDLPGGIYFLEVTTPTRRMKTKLMKQ